MDHSIHNLQPTLDLLFLLICVHRARRLPKQKHFNAVQVLHLVAQHKGQALVVAN